MGLSTRECPRPDQELTLPPSTSAN